MPLEEELCVIESFWSAWEVTWTRFMTPHSAPNRFLSLKLTELTSRQNSASGTWKFHWDISQNSSILCVPVEVLVIQTSVNTSKARDGIQFILMSSRRRRRPWPQVRRVSCRAPAADSRRLVKSWAGWARDPTSLRLPLARFSSVDRTSSPAKNLVWPRKIKVN